MPRYSKSLVEEIRKLRSRGKTYSEIMEIVGVAIPKGSISHICRFVKLPDNYFRIINDLNLKSLSKARKISAVARRLNKQRFLREIRKTNLPISRQIKDKGTAKIALAMLCLGEATKSGTTSSFALGNTDARIILLFINLLKYCFPIDPQRFNGGVQCRADQNVEDLEQYWSEVSEIPRTHFYKTFVDPRTFGKPTMKPNYKGVFTVYYHDSKIRLDLESLADLVYNKTL